jgi:signal transduction histidine kinase/DNA-binding response OmpR family regulator
MLNLDWHFHPVVDSLDPATALPGTYDLGLVATSLAIAILAAFVALSISGRIVAATTPRARYAWASAGALSMGGGIWAMHFIGMLAFSLPCGVTYDPVGTVASMIPGILASGIALNAISKSDAPSLGRLAVSSVLMGAGIGAMHYSGMAAMLPEALLRYSPGLVAISIVVAVVLAYVSLSIRFQFHHSQSPGIAATLMAASVMGCAVAGMHYTAMQAAIFFPLPDAPVYNMALSPTLLALLITIFTVLIGASTLVATFAGRQNELALSLTAEIARRKRTEEDLVRAREQAEAANRAKSQFLATMSHEIRTPMNGVLGMATLLSSTSLNERQRRLVENLARSGKALLGTINDILDFSKIEAGRFELFNVEFDPREVVAEVTDLFAEPCASKGLEFVYFVAEEVPSQMRGDPVRLRQILINLVGNAIKFTERGEILVEMAVAEMTPDQCVLICSVMDTGIGMSAEHAGRVFESFYQADHPTTRARGGTGLGLAIAKHLVTLMGGDIGVESTLGRGSRFRFSARMGHGSADAARARTGRRIEPPLRVMLVDTNAVSAQVLASYLKSWRIDVTCCATVQDAERAWSAAAGEGRGFGAVIIDVKGLGTAGIELARHIRTDERGRTVGIIALAAIDSFVVDESLERLGVFATLTKPARPSELFNCLASLAAGERRGKTLSFPLWGSSDARARFDARVLVVEDNPVNQEVAMGMLDAMGCRSVTASNGSVAVQLFAESKFDLILMDCEMPVMDGFEAAMRIREIERIVGDREGGRTPRVPIVAVTAHALTAVHERSLAAGMDDFLVKPYDQAQLAAALRRWVPDLERIPAAEEATGEDAVSVPPQAADDQAIDLAKIEEIRTIKIAGSETLLKRVVSQFISTAPGLAAAIRAKTMRAIPRRFGAPRTASSPAPGRSALAGSTGTAPTSRLTRGSRVWSP